MRLFQLVDSADTTPPTDLEEVIDALITQWELLTEENKLLLKERDTQLRLKSASDSNTKLKDLERRFSERERQDQQQLLALAEENQGLE